ncbi:MAG: S-layer homology domain-containing protein [Oscillospiraceae bacterium]
MALCTQEGILQGSNGSFLPKGKLTRAQTAAILYRLSEQ